MRRLYVGLAILAFTVLAPVGARANDRQIAQQIVERLQERKAKGTLTDFSIDLQVKDGVVRLKGYVTRPEHERQTLELVRQVPGVQGVQSELDIRTPAKADAASTSRLKAVSVSTAKNARPAPADPAPSTDDPKLEPVPHRSSEEIASAIARALQQQKEQGNLKDFGVDIRVQEGAVRLSGRVANDEQLDLVLEQARQVPGVTQVTHAITVSPSRARGGAANAGPQRSSELLPTSAEQEAPVSVDADSEQLAQEVKRRLQKQKDAGALKDFDIDIDVENGSVWLSGRVSSTEQLNLVLDQARYVPGVKQVVNGLSISSTSRRANPVSTNQGRAEGPSPAAVPAELQTPLAFAPARPADYQQAVPSAAAPGGQPVPMPMPGAGAGAARFDQPQLPAHAWPSYAPYPNYGAVTYPRQYSASAWPYIGPFYPYPQVPLGWRKVTLEWDDGWWQLDFKSR